MNEQAGASPPMGFVHLDGTLDNRVPIQWWIAKLFESTHVRYRLGRRWEQLRGKSVRPDTAWIHRHIEALALMQAQSYFPSAESLD